MSEQVSSMPTTGRSLDTILFQHQLSLDFFEDATVLDLGSGNSNLGRDLAIEGITAHVISIDMNAKALASAAKYGNIAPVQADITALPIQDSSIDIALAA